MITGGAAGSLEDDGDEGAAPAAADSNRVEGNYFLVFESILKPTHAFIPFIPLTYALFYLFETIDVK